MNGVSLIKKKSSAFGYHEQTMISIQQKHILKPHQLKALLTFWKAIWVLDIDSQAKKSQVIIFLFSLKP